jgi:hypothetical protein
MCYPRTLSENHGDRCNRADLENRINLLLGEPEMIRFRRAGAVVWSPSV